MCGISAVCGCGVYADGLLPGDSVCGFPHFGTQEYDDRRRPYGGYGNVQRDRGAAGSGEQFFPTA